MENTTTPYANLDPDTILNAIESAGFQCSGSLSALNSFENRVYQIGIEESDPLIAKFYRPNRWSDAAIIEEHQFSLELQNHEIPVIAPLLGTNGESLHKHHEFRFALFPRRGGHALELGDLNQIEWMGRFLGRLHAVGAIKPFHDRLKLVPDNYGEYPHRFLIEKNFIPEELISSYSEIADKVYQQIVKRFNEVGDVTYLRIHGDCHAGNVLWNTAGPHIVDLDDCLYGPAVQDMWMLLTGNHHEAEIQLHHLLHGYQQFHDFNYKELELIEALRALRIIQYSVWLGKRWEDPAFPLNFPWFTTRAYWQEQIHLLREQSLLLQNSTL